MESLDYRERRGQLEAYFDRTAAETWARLTSDAPLGRVRSTVREGRDAMRARLLSWLPADLRGRRLLDAGCGTGALAAEAAARGAEVVAVDLAGSLVELARQRNTEAGPGSIEFRTGDMLEPGLGDFDHVVAMDSLIHYEAPDMVRMLGKLAAHCRESILFTFAPWTPLLGAMHAAGRLFPRADRAPSIEPVRPVSLSLQLVGWGPLAAWAPVRSERVARGFYISHAMELSRS